MATANKQIDSLYRQARETALKELKRLVEIKFRQNKNLDYFLIAMGSYFFVDKNNETVYDGFKNIDNLIGEWDRYLKLTGEGVKWYADGSVITDW